ncbi:MAG: polysaccharide deacetylase family protein [Clostridia bacterium]|nr:polysaccharide deacetylase family protein [Clostridia bacterium]
MYPNGKLKAITLSFDDGVIQDRRLIEILNRYGLKGTFNLNSQLFNVTIQVGSTVRIDHTKIDPSEVAPLYSGHEVAVHTLTHPNLTTLSDEEIIRQVEEDRKNLSALCGYEVIGMAYPCGGVNNNDHVAAVIRENTGVQYSRTITSTYSYEQQENLYRFNPTIHVIDSRTEEICRAFLEAEFDSPKLLYLWGHSYEFDFDNSWDRFEAICKLISGHDDIFYGTNREVFGL